MRSPQQEGEWVGGLFTKDTWSPHPWSSKQAMSSKNICGRGVSHSTEQLPLGDHIQWGPVQGLGTQCHRLTSPWSAHLQGRQAISSKPSEGRYSRCHCSREGTQRQSWNITFSFHRSKNAQETKYLKIHTSVGLFLYITMLICKIKGRTFQTALETSAYFYNRSVTDSISLNPQVPRPVFCFTLKCHLKIKFYPVWNPRQLKKTRIMWCNGLHISITEKHLKQEVKWLM